MQPLTPVTAPALDERLVRELQAKHPEITTDQLRTMLEERNTGFFINEKYQVAVYYDEHPDWIQINIRRRDGKPIFRDWREFQAIKNQLVGPSHEAVELYPAEDRLVDTANKYHLWVARDPTYRFPFGWTTRSVMDKTGTTRPGLMQRKLAK